MSLCCSVGSYARNMNVETENVQYLKRLAGRERTFEALDTGKPNFVARLQKDCAAPTVLRLKVNAQVCEGTPIGNAARWTWR